MSKHRTRMVGVALAFTVVATLACNAPGWTQIGSGSDATATSTAEPTPSPTATSTAPRTATPTATATATETPAAEVTGPNDCIYDSLYVADVTIPDDTEMAPGESFEKVWRVRNSGTCTWESGVKLVYLADDRMGEPGALEVPRTEPDKTAELGLDLIAPLTAGTWRSTWRLQTPDGQFFGNRFYVPRVAVVTTVTPTPTLTATATITATSVYTVDHPFDGVWDVMGGAEGDLGHPIANGVTGHETAEQEFEGGGMYWRQEFGSTPAHIFVLTRAGASISTGTWTRHVDTWEEGDDEVSCDDTPIPGGPVRGFGVIWCDNAAVKLAMGLPVAAEEGSSAGFQEFAGGTLLWSPRLSVVYSLLNDGTWQRFFVTP